MLVLATPNLFQYSWDLANATEQSTDLVPDLAAELLEISRTQLVPLPGEGGFFGPEFVPPAGSPSADVLAGFWGAPSDPPHGQCSWSSNALASVKRRERFVEACAGFLVMSREVEHRPKRGCRRKVQHGPPTRRPRHGARRVGVGKQFAAVNVS
jgi:hypothetical protein